MRCFYVLKKWSSEKLSLNRDLSLNNMSLNRDCTVLHIYPNYQIQVGIMTFLRLGFRPHVPSEFFQILDFQNQNREMDGIFVSASSDLRKPNVISLSHPGVNIVFESREVPPGLVFSKFDLFRLSFT